MQVVNTDTNNTTILIIVLIIGIFAIFATLVFLLVLCAAKSAKIKESVSRGLRRSKGSSDEDDKNDEEEKTSSYKQPDTEYQEPQHFEPIPANPPDSCWESSVLSLPPYLIRRYQNTAQLDFPRQSQASLQSEPSRSPADITEIATIQAEHRHSSVDELS